MDSEKKLNKLITTHRGRGEGESWIFSVIPVGVAFTFYMLFIMTTELENKDVFMVYGAAAAFIGLESYWIVHGWRRNHGSTVVLGVLGIVATLGLLSLYLSFK